MFSSLSTELMIKRFSYKQIDAKNILFLLPLVAIIFVPIYSALVVKFGKKSLLMIISFSLAIAAYTLAFLLPNEPSNLHYLFIFLLGQHRSLYSSCVWSSILQASPSKIESLTIGIGLFFSNVFLGLLPIWFGHLAESDDEPGFQNVLGNLVILSILCLINSICVFVADKRNGSLLYIGENTKTAKLLKDRINKGIYGPLKTKTN
jgi:MFS family permease